MEPQQSKTGPETASAPKNEPKADSADNHSEVEAAPGWSEQVQRSVRRGLATGQVAAVAVVALVDLNQD